MIKKTTLETSASASSSQAREPRVEYQPELSLARSFRQAIYSTHLREHESVKLNFFEFGSPTQIMDIRNFQAGVQALLFSKKVVVGIFIGLHFLVHKQPDGWFAVHGKPADGYFDLIEK